MTLLFAKVRVINSTNCELISSLTIWKNDFTLLTKLYDNMDNVWDISAELPSSIEITGPAKWLLKVGEDKQQNVNMRTTVLLDNHHIANDITDTLSNILGGQLVSIERVGLTAVERPIGLQSRVTIPDSAMTSNSPYNNHIPENARLHVSTYHTNINGWLQVDLGNIFRIYGLKMRGKQYAAEAPYITSSFSILYGNDAADLRYYEESGTMKTFTGSSSSNWWIVQSRLFSIITRHIRFVCLSGYTCAIALEYYGCRVLENDGVYEYKAGSQLVRHTYLEIGNNQIPLELLSSHKFILSVSHAIVSESIDVKVVYQLSAPCSQINILAMVHRYAETENFSAGTYLNCRANDMILSDGQNIQTFHCTCSYGFCENVIFIITNYNAEPCVKLFGILLDE